MSVETELTRLKNAKTSIKRSITSKGVTVPSSTRYDGFAALIDKINQGKQVYTGVYTGDFLTGKSIYTINTGIQLETNDTFILINAYTEDFKYTLLPGRVCIGALRTSSTDTEVYVIDTDISSMLRGGGVSYNKTYVTIEPETLTHMILPTSRWYIVRG